MVTRLASSTAGLLSIFVLLHSFAFAAPQDGEAKLYRIQPKDMAKTMLFLQQEDFDIAGVNVREGHVDVIASAKELAKLEQQKQGLSFVDVVQPTEIALDPRYLSSQEVAEKLQAFANEYPEITLLEEIGRSVLDQPIYAIKISDNAAMQEPEEPAILYNAMHHAREVMSPEVAIDTIEYLLTQYGENQQVADWVNNNEIWVVPMLNVDGNDKVWGSQRMWRKNVGRTYGVDINRNYPYAWNSCNGSSGSPFSQTYRGPSAASEPETNALMGLVERIRPVFSISYHSYSEMVLYPFGCDGEHASNAEVVAGIGREMAELLPTDYGEGHYVHGTPWEILYSVDGGDIDWMHAAYGVIPYVIELNSTQLGFQPSYDWRDPTVQKMRAGWSMLLDRVEESGIRGVVTLETLPQGTAVTARIENLDRPNQAAQVYALTPAGTFHFVLMPGTYQLSLSGDGRTSMAETVVVAEDRVDLNLTF